MSAVKNWFLQVSRLMWIRFFLFHRVYFVFMLNKKESDNAFASIWLFGLIFHLIVGSIGLEPMKTKANRFTVYPVCHFGNYPFCGSRRIQTSEAFQLASLAKRWYRSLTHTSNMRPTRHLCETTAFPLYFGRYSFCVAYQRIELWFPPWKGDDLTVSRIRHLLRYKDLNLE